MRESGISALEDHLGYWLRFVSNHVSHAFSRKVEAHGVTVAEWVVLRELFDCEATAPSELAERLGMSRGAISKLGDRLIAKGLVSKTPCETDRRYYAIALTGRGRTLVPKLAGLADQNDHEFFGGLDAAERDALLTVMKKLVQSHGFKSVPTG